MNLKRKLLTIFGGLGLLALVTAGSTVWAIGRWQTTNDQLRNHYQRSLLLQRVRAATFRAFKEVPDAVAGDDPDSREEFDQFIAPAEADFQEWASLAETEAERQQVQQVRQAYETLITDARRTFDLVESGRRAEAFLWMEGRLEDRSFQPFQDLTEAAVVSDQNYRQVVLGRVENTRHTTQLVLAIAAFGTISLVLLLFAYLSSDLFAPLGEVKDALDDVARGERQHHLDNERSDEIGRLNQAFNRMIDAIAQREQLIAVAAVPGNGTFNPDNGGCWQNAPSKAMLHQLVSHLRSRVIQLNQGYTANGNGSVAVQQKQELVEELDGLLQTISRITDFGFPLDLNLAKTDIRGLLYEVLLRFHDEFARQGVSFELDIAPEVDYALVDRLKLREALGELVRNALAALPEKGGYLGVRSSIVNEGGELLLEVADSGKGIEQPLINQAFAPLDEASENRSPNVGLRLTKTIVEQHGGHLHVDSQPNQGTYVQIKLPLRD